MRSGSSLQEEGGVKQYDGRRFRKTERGVVYDECFYVKKEVYRYVIRPPIPHTTRWV